MAEQQITTRRDSYHHGDLKTALINATQELIEEKGIDQFSVSDACRRAGVSTAAPYKHFKNREEMVMATVLDAMRRHRDTLGVDLAPHEKGTLERIAAMGLNYVRFAQDEPEMFRLRFDQRVSDPNPELKASGQAIYGLVQEEVRAALGESEINDRVRERAFMLWSFVHGMSYIYMQPEFADKTPPQSIEDMLLSIGQRVLRD